MLDTTGPAGASSAGASSAGASSAGASSAGPALFRPLQLRGLNLRNRIAVSPMTQYSAEDGCAMPWHVMHIGSMAISGAGLVIMEATAVESIGRTTPGCLGLYSDANGLCPSSCAKALGHGSVDVSLDA